MRKISLDAHWNIEHLEVQIEVVSTYEPTIRNFILFYNFPNSLYRRLLQGPLSKVGVNNIGLTRWACFTQEVVVKEK